MLVAVVGCWAYVARIKHDTNSKQTIRPSRVIILIEFMICSLRFIPGFQSTGRIRVSRICLMCHLSFFPVTIS